MTISRLVAAVFILALAVAGFSYIQAMTAPSSLPLTMRTVEWMRDNGGAGLVNFAERIYYSATAPKTGGPGLNSVPRIGSPDTTHAVGNAVVAPHRIIGSITPMLPNEGVWRGTSRVVLGGIPVRATVFRPEAAYPRQLAYVAWIDTSRVHLELYPGRVQPPNVHPRGPMEVPISLRSRLLATFNSGFTYKDSLGGFAARGKTIKPMRAGQATIIEYSNGRIDIVNWNGGSSVDPDVVLARQNLPLLVVDGSPSPKIADDSAWGRTLGNAVRVWRSAIGIDADGNLVYLAAPGQTAESLAEAMIQVGAVRAMQLDINSFWPSFNTYSRAGARGATKLVPNPNHPAARYLTPDDRDFFAVYSSSRLNRIPQ